MIRSDRLDVHVPLPSILVLCAGLFSAKVFVQWFPSLCCYLLLVGFRSMNEFVCVMFGRSFPDTKHAMNGTVYLSRPPDRVPLPLDTVPCG